MARDPGTYSEEIVREFYAFYASTLRGSISKWSKPLAQDPLTSTLVQGCPVDISPATIRRFLYGPTMGHSWALNTSEYIAADGERAKWVAASRLGIRKATLNFVAKFFWMLVRNRVSPTKADNQVTWDRAVMVAALVAGVEIDFARILLAEIHERAFRTSTTYPFPCLIFQLCMDFGVSIWQCDRVHPIEALDIGLIRDEANVATAEVSCQGDDLKIPDHTDNRPAPHLRQLAWLLVLPGPHRSWELLSHRRVRKLELDGHAGRITSTVDAKSRIANEVRG
ncbi:hypothetical protein H5410_015955 [Solanum commersonii]|uniref:Putative plant transposon protein domain-containing protein n=1 Tax=Solanum commersonii TaxID=4109 RepID=A0A9J5ZVN6_SOLCO|nr:hypothetical protein H5410_015955 [Solanum commersonii]